MVQSIKRILVGMVLAFLTLFAAPGDLDATFGSGGKVTTDFGVIIDSAWFVALQSDGRIVVAGTANLTGAGYSNFILARYNADGTLDTTFGSGGKVTTDFAGDDDYGNSVAIQSNGRIVVAGTTDVSGVNSDFALACYNADGTLDTTFGSGGKVTTDFDGFDNYGNSVALQSDGKIVVAGSVYLTGSDFALVRYNADGTLDTTFGSSGKVTTDFDGFDNYGHSVAIQNDGRIVVAGNAFVSGMSTNFALARYDTNGSLDTTFGSGGKVTTDFAGNTDQGYSIALQSDGKIVVAGSAYVPGGNSDFALARYNVDGTLDTAFGSGGKVTTDFAGSYNWGHSVAIQSNGRIVVAGTTAVALENTDFALARYDTNGTLDTTFGSGGKVTTDFTGFLDTGHSVALQSDGRIVVAGNAGSVMARYEGDPTDVPEIDVNPLSLDYSDVIIGNTKELNVTVSNIGIAELTVSGVSISGANETEFSQTHNCAAVAVESSCTIDVTFTPATAGAKIATLSIDSDDADEATVDVSLIANAKTPQMFSDDIVAFIDASVLSGDLQGTGSGNSALKRVNALRNMIIKAKEWIDYGDIPAACEQLADAYKKTDGENRPPDFVSGSATEELAAMIQELQQSLGC